MTREDGLRRPGAERPPVDDEADHVAVARMMREIRDADPPMTGGVPDFWELPIVYARHLRDTVPDWLLAQAVAAPFAVAVFYVLVGPEPPDGAQIALALALSVAALASVKAVQRLIRFSKRPPGDVD